MARILRSTARVPRVAFAVSVCVLTALLAFPSSFQGPSALEAPGAGASVVPAVSVSAHGHGTGAALGRVAPPTAPARDGASLGRVASREVFPPSPPITTGDSTGGREQPGYEQNPAPMGLADLGERSTGPYIYNSSSFQAAITFQSRFSVYDPGYAALAESPSWSTIQLNTVAVGIGYPGAPSGHYGTFWVQNVVHLNGSVLEFEDNLWNFTTAGSSVFPWDLIHPAGTFGPSTSGQYYFRSGPTLAVPSSYPFTLDLYNSVSLVGYHATIYLNYSLAGGPIRSYDAVTFATVQTGTPAFQVSGLGVDGSGHWNDAELVLGGDGSGSNTMVQQLNATVSLQRWNATLSSFESVPSAYDYGVDSGETAEGIAATYAGTTETLEQGPSMLYGLWGTASSPTYGPSAAPGAIRVALTVVPAWGFVFATDNISLRTAPTLADAKLAYFPTDASGVGSTELPPPSGTDPYELLAWAAGYANSSASPVPVKANSTGLPLNLALDSSSPLQAPVYLFGDAEAEAFGSSGIPSVTYTSSNHTLSIAPASDALAAPFLRLNDFRFPTFVLFAADDLNISVQVNGFTQAPGASTYAIDLGSSVTYSGYSQGYFFFYGAGAFDVTHTTTPGNSTGYWENGAYPPAAVEFFDTTGSRASDIVSDQESFGVTFVNATGGTAANLTSRQGANAVDAIYSRGVEATNVSAVGLDYRNSPSWGAYVLNASAVDLSRLSAVDEAAALVGSNSSWNVLSLSVDNAFAIEAFNTSSSNVTGLTVSDTSSVAYAGYWYDSTGIDMSQVSVVGEGLDLEGDSDVSMVGVTASGFGSEALYDFLGCSNGSFSYVNATDQALGLNLSGGTNVSVRSVTATGGSVGVYMFDANETEATGVLASNLSAGVVWQFGEDGTIVNAQASDESLAVEVTNASDVSVAEISARNATVGQEYFYNPAMGFLLPDAALELGNDSNTSVTGLSADGYAFGVQANYTNGVVLRNATVWDGGIALSLNATNNTTVSSLFSYGEDVGVDDVNSTNVTLISSTLEDSASYGFESLNGSLVAIAGNNFVANNGASATGAFSGAHVQASVTGTTNVTLSSNYWSDAAGRSSYTVNKTRVDRTPVASFLGNWLEFQESGLPAGHRWTLGVLNVLYGTATPVVYLPSWAVPDGTFAFLVFPPSGYVATPPSGPVTFSGANLTVTIQFASSGGASGGSGGFPLWGIAVAAGLGVVAVVVAVLVILRRSPAPPGGRPRTRRRRVRSRPRMFEDRGAGEQRPPSPPL
jgi:uncharacterized protein YcfL